MIFKRRTVGWAKEQSDVPDTKIVGHAMLSPTYALNRILLLCVMDDHAW